MAVDFESFNDVLKHPIRRKVILALGTSKTLSYVELLNLAECSNTGKFNYHLKVLGDLIEKDNAGKYSLTEKGQLALQFLQKFPEKKPEPATRLHMADALLIGLAGFALIAANPILWIGLLLEATKTTVPEFTFPLFGVGSMLYSVLVPSGVMWLLTVRRAHSHEMYDLLRAPVIMLIAYILLLVFMFLTGFKYALVAEIKAPLIITQHGSSQHLTFVSFPLNAQNSIIIFLGVPIIELARRIRKKLRSRG